MPPELGLRSFGVVGIGSACARVERVLGVEGKVGVGWVFGVGD